MSATPSPGKLPARGRDRSPATSATWPSRRAPRSRSRSSRRRSGTIVNQASVDSAQADDNPADNSDTETDRGRAGPGISAPEGRDAAARARWCRPTTSARPRTASHGPPLAFAVVRAARAVVAAPDGRDGRRERQSGQLGRLRAVRGACRAIPCTPRGRGRRRRAARASPTCGARPTCRLHAARSQANVDRCGSPTATTRSRRAAAPTPATVVDIPFPVHGDLRGDGRPVDRQHLRGRDHASTRSCPARSGRASARSGQLGQVEVYDGGADGDDRRRSRTRSSPSRASSFPERVRRRASAARRWRPGRLSSFGHANWAAPGPRKRGDGCRRATA